MAGPIAFYAPDPTQSTQLIPGGNTPASGAQLFVYTVGTTTKQNSYTDPSASTARTNPIVLDSGGNIPGNGEVWIVSSAKFVLAPSNDTDPPSSPYWTRDNVPGINNITAAQVQALSGQNEWVQGSTATFVGATLFSVSGDQTPLYTIGRRVKIAVTGGDRFGNVTSVALASGTTSVGVFLDSGTLNGGLSSVQYGILSTPNGSVPWIQFTTTGVFFEAPVSTGTLTATSLIAVSVTSASLGITSSSIFSSSVTRQAGNTTTYGSIPAVIYKNFTYTSSAFNTNTVLHSYTLPASSFVSDGSGIRITAGGWHTASGSTETLIFKLNNQNLISQNLSSSTPSGWKVVAEILRSGSSTQQLLTSLFEAPNTGLGSASGYFSNVTSTANNDASTMTFSFIAAANTASTIVQNITTIEYFQ